MFEAITLENIRSAVDKADETLEVNQIDLERRIQYRILIEELLLNYRERDENATFRLEFKRYFKKLLLILSVSCERSNVLESHPDLLFQNLLSELDQPPTWRYHSGKNIITMMPVTFLPDLSSLKSLWQYMTTEKTTFIAAVVLRFVNLAIAVLEPVLSAAIIVAYSGSEIRKIIIVASLILLEAVVSNLINYVSSRLLRNSYSSMVKEMRCNSARNVLTINTNCMDKNGSGVFISRLIDETANVIEEIDSLLDSTTQIFQLGSLLIAFALISSKMLLFEVVQFIIYILILNAESNRVAKETRLCCIANEKHTSFIGEMVRAHRDIKLLHCEESFLARQRSIVEETADQITEKRIMVMKHDLVNSLYIGVTSFLYMILLAVLMARDGMAASTALILFNYNGRVFSCASYIPGFMGTIYSLGLSAERLYQLSASRDFAGETFGTGHLDGVRGEIELRDVHFAYRDNEDRRVPVLKGLNLTIHAGETIAIVGRSGCGKSTTLNLISRLFEPDQGAVLLDGHDISELDQDTIRGNIAMVSQMPYIFNMSIRDNLRIVKKDLTDEEMVEVCKMACIHDEIMVFPQGYDTVVGEGGVSLSGGQRQRLALARALVRNYPIMMLDEATSALDNVTQSQIRKALDNIQGRNTIILVAHRLSTVINSNCLYFLSDGKVLAQGTHQELLESCEEYRRLYSEETGGEKTGAGA